MAEVIINICAQQENFEIMISGNSADFISLTNYLFQNLTRIFPLTKKPDAYYPKSMSFLSTELLEQSNGLITVHVIDDELRLTGDSQALLKMGGFLESMQNLRPNEHFHLDWFGNENLLSPATSNMSFIFFMEA